MNILKHEFRAGRKPFILWSIGLFILVFLSMVKFTGISGTSGMDINEVMNQFPKVVLAVLGVGAVDISTLGGYYSVIIYYALLCSAIYGVALGVNAVNREAIDKTFEFLFTKPRSRMYILTMKYLTAIVYLSIFCLLNCLFSFMAVAALNFGNTIGNAILLYTLILFLIGLLFLSIGGFVAAIVKKPEKGSLFGNLCFLSAFLFSTVYGMLEHGGILKIIAPFQYFLPQDVLAGKIDFFYVTLCMIIVLILIIRTFQMFNRKDFIN